MSRHNWFSRMTVAGIVLAFASLPTTASAQPPADGTGADAAASLVAAMNSGDVDGVVSLFADEATVYADRYAWLDYEIRIWAEINVDRGLIVEPRGPIQDMGQHVVWQAALTRNDWRAVGVERLDVSEDALIEDGKITSLTVTPLDPNEVARLGDLWQPRAAPSASEIQQHGQQPAGLTEPWIVAPGPRDILYA